MTVTLFGAEVSAAEAGDAASSNRAAAVPGPTRLKERRGHKRRNTLRMRLTFLGAEHDATNWSLGGFLVKDTHPDTPIGTTAAGFLSIIGIPGRFGIRIELVRRDKRTR